MGNPLEVNDPRRRHDPRLAFTAAGNEKGEMIFPPCYAILF
jgi:hypothetical protein